MFGYGYGSGDDKISALRDMLNGGGAGRAGRTFEGGGILSDIANSVARPMGSSGLMEVQSSPRPQARPQYAPPQQAAPAMPYSPFPQARPQQQPQQDVGPMIAAAMNAPRPNPFVAALDRQQAVPQIQMMDARGTQHPDAIRGLQMALRMMGEI